MRRCEAKNFSFQKWQMLQVHATMINTFNIDSIYKVPEAINSACAIRSTVKIWDFSITPVMLEEVVLEEVDEIKCLQVFRFYNFT